MIIKWTKSLKKRFGWDTSKDVHVLSKECFNRNCFHPHDWHHDRHLVCLTNAVHGCPQRKDNEGSRGQFPVDPLVRGFEKRSNRAKGGRDEG